MIEGEEPNTLDYILSIEDPDVRTAAVKALPKEGQLMLVKAISERLDNFTSYIVQNEDEIYETGVMDICKLNGCTPGKFLHQALAKHTDVHECSKCGKPCYRKAYVS
jgi:hypothetical protein